MSQTIVDKRNQFQKWNKQSIYLSPFLIQKIIKCILFYIIKLKTAILLLFVVILKKINVSLLK